MTDEKQAKIQGLEGMNDELTRQNNWLQKRAAEAIGQQAKLAAENSRLLGQILDLRARVARLEALLEQITDSVERASKMISGERGRRTRAVGSWAREAKIERCRSVWHRVAVMGADALSDGRYAVYTSCGISLLAADLRAGTPEATDSPVCMVCLERSRSEEGGQDAEAHE